MNHLLRELAPITPTGWAAIDDEARSRLLPVLNARKLVDFVGPLGWDHSATDLGRVQPLTETPVAGVTGRRRVALPLAELRVDFTLSRAELDAADRGAADVDLSDLDRAAATLAAAENSIVFDGWRAAGFDGIVARVPERTTGRFGAERSLPQLVATAVARLRDAGVDGPYGLALDDAGWIAAEGTTEHGGATISRHLERILGGPTLHVPGVRGPVVVSLRGGDFLMECGQDVSVGYVGHSADTVELYLEETFSFRVATPEAAAVLFEDSDE